MIRDDSHENLIQELRLVSNSDSKLNWVVGAYYADRRVFQETLLRLLPLIGAEEVLQDRR